MAKQDLYIPNLSTLFLLPLLKLDKDILLQNINKSKKDIERRFVNTFTQISFIDRYKEPNYLFILHSNYRNLEYSKFDDHLRCHELCVDDFEIGSGLYSIKVFDLIDIKESELFHLGKYSEFGEDAQDLCKNRSIVVGAFKDLREIFEKDDKRRIMVEKKQGVKPGTLIGYEICELPGKKEIFTKDKLNLLDPVKTIKENNNFLKPKENEINSRPETSFSERNS